MDELWLDTETRSTLDVKKVGAAKLAEDPTLQILSAHFAVDDEPVAHWRGAFAPGAADFEDPERNPAFARFLDGIEADKPVWCHNAPFDFQVWNACAARYGFPALRLEQMRDSAAVARSLNLPGSLGAIAKIMGRAKLENRTYHKLWKIGKDGSYHCTEDMRPTYEEMLKYGDVDVEEMRFFVRNVPVGVDWDEYHTAERINLRGVSIDLPWCREALLRRDIVMEEVKGELDYLTYGAVKTPKQSTAARLWVEAELLRAGLIEPDQHITKQFKKRRPGDVTFYTETRPCFDKATRRELRETLLEGDDPEEIAHVLDVLDLLEEGAAAAVSKYEAATKRTCADGRMRGMYVFGGAQQTGRFTSNGMQTHNLKRAQVKGSIKEAQQKARTLEELSTLLRATLKAGG